MDKPNYYCFCGNVHVLTGTRLIGTIGFLLFSFFISFFISEEQFILSILIFFIFIIPFILLIFADRQRSSKFYLPFLLLNIILIILNSLYLIFIGIMIFLMPNFWQNHFELFLDIKEENKSYYLIIITIFIFIIFVLIQLILFWCHSIVANAYNYMNKDKIILIPPQLSYNFVVKTSTNRKNKKLFNNRQSQLA